MYVLLTDKDWATKTKACFTPVVDELIRLNLERKFPKSVFAAAYKSSRIFESCNWLSFRPTNVLAIELHETP